MDNAPKRIWATMMDSDCARSGTFVDCAEFPTKPNADAVQYMPVDLGPAPSWQPIETAPKDGTPVMLAQFHPWSFATGRPEKSCIGACVKTQGMKTHEFKRRVVRNGLARFYCLDGWFLSHWKPLPAPPEAD